MGIEINLWWQELLEKVAKDIARERVERLVDEGKLPTRAYASPVDGYGDSGIFHPHAYRNTFRFQVHGHSTFEVKLSDVLRRVLQDEEPS